MSSFTTPADLRMLENYRWQLLAEFDYYMGEQTMQRFTAAFQGHAVRLFGRGNYKRKVGNARKRPL